MVGEHEFTREQRPSATLSLLIHCEEISICAKYAGWNDLHDLDDLNDFDATVVVLSAATCILKLYN